MTGAPGGEDRLDKMGLVALHQGNYDLAESLFGRDLERLAPKSPARGGRTGFLGDVEVARGNLDRTLPYFEEGAGRGKARGGSMECRTPRPASAGLTGETACPTRVARRAEYPKPQFF